MNLAIGEILLIKQTSLVLVSPWGYRLVYLPTPAIVVTASGLTADYVLVTLSSGTYASYAGKSLLLEILNNAGNVIEEDLLVLSGVYRKYPEIKLLAGLLGENCKHIADQATDYQDGHEKHKEVTLYNEVALTTEMAVYTWNQSFVTDFRPDARYQTQLISQRKDS